MKRFFLSLIKWFPVGICGSFALFFLINSKPILCVLAIGAIVCDILTKNQFLEQRILISKSKKPVVRYTWRDRHRPSNGPILKYEEPKINIDWPDWQKIDVFDETVEWQNILADEIIDLSVRIVSVLGKPSLSESGQYENDIIRICRKRDQESPYINDIVTVDLLPDGVRVLKVNKATIVTFRVGNWIDHIKALEPEIEQVQQERREKSEQLEREYHIRNFSKVN